MKMRKTINVGDVVYVRATDTKQPGILPNNTWLRGRVKAKFNYNGHDDLSVRIEGGPYILAWKYSECAFLNTGEWEVMTEKEYNEMTIKSVNDALEVLNTVILSRKQAASELVTEANKLRGYLIKTDNKDSLNSTYGVHKSIWRTVARNNHKMFAAKRQAIRLKALHNISEKYVFCKEEGKFKSKFVPVK